MSNDVEMMNTIGNSGPQSSSGNTKSQAGSQTKLYVILGVILLFIIVIFIFSILTFTTLIDHDKDSDNDSKDTDNNTDNQVVTSDDTTINDTTTIIDDYSVELSVLSTTYSDSATCDCGLTKTDGCCLDISDFGLLSSVFDNIFNEESVITDTEASSGTLLGEVVYDYSDDNVTDWVIVGAGAAGLYMANALLDDNPERKIKIIEQLDRVGGRLFSLNLRYIPTGDVIQLEMGGMRFLDSQIRLNKLLNYIDICDSKMLFSHGTRSGENPYFLRNNRFTVNASLYDASYWRNTYNIKQSEDCEIQGWINETAHVGWPMCYYVHIFDVLKEQNDGFIPTSADDWQYIRNNWKYNGITLNSISFTVMLREMGFSNEALRLMAGGSGFITSFWQSEVNAGDALQLYVAEYFKNEQFYTLRGGYDLIATGLQNRLRVLYSQQTVFEFGQNVTDIKKYKNFYQVTSYDSNSDYAESILDPFHTYTSNIAITMDSGQLQRQLPGFEPINTPYVSSLVYGATEQRLSKINFIFDEDLGKDMNISYNGGSFSDSQVASWYMVDAWRNDTNDTNFYAAVIYCDYFNSDFWWSLYDPDDPYMFDSSLLEVVNDEGSDNLRNQWNASNAQVEMGLTLLNEMFNITFPMPLAAFYSPWGTGTRYGGSTNFFTVGVNDTLLQEQIWQPLEDHEIYICNEAYSNDHGWVEGTIQSCDKILNGLNIDLPWESQDACVYQGSDGTEEACPGGAISADRWTCQY